MAGYDSPEPFPPSSYSWDRPSYAATTIVTRYFFHVTSRGVDDPHQKATRPANNKVDKFSNSVLNYVPAQFSFAKERQQQLDDDGVDETTT